MKPPDTLRASHAYQLGLKEGIAEGERRAAARVRAALAARGALAAANESRRIDALARRVNAGEKP
jgi:hypothetical protein